MDGELGEQLASGRMVLFTGAGFSADAVGRGGDRVPTSEQLRRLLWQVAFPGEPLDESDLGDVYECALAVDAEATGTLLRERLHVRPDALPAVYGRWFSLPWSRIYTLNVDDLDEAAQERFDLPPLRSVSALGGELPAHGDATLSIHLNGRIAEFPELTFSNRQYGWRTAVPDPWYQHLALDLASRPFLFVGTKLDEPPLWQQLALRLDPGAARPRSYLVSRRLPVARQRVLREMNVEWIQADQQDFAETVLAPLQLPRSA